MRFDEFKLDEQLMEGLEAMNFVNATPIQSAAIPTIIDGQDLIACAQTGTGKTAAFLLPLIHNLLTQSQQSDAVNAIIMSPTRELAQQIDQQLEGLAYFVPVTSIPIYGGTNAEAWDTQRKALQSGADVVIATPGRLISHLNLSEIDLSQVKYFILDEADRMLDMGFYDDIMQIVNRLPKERQTLLFSATMPQAIRKLANSILKPTKKEIHLAISKPPETIMQTAYICHEQQKLGIVKHLFIENTSTKSILFSGKKQRVKELTKTLHQMGIKVAAMHSDLAQTEREQIMLDFKNNHIKMLVATDIVSRGIDIDDIDLVINYEVPYDVEDYVHRIGRTARAGDEGMAITLVAPTEQARFKQIEDFIDKEIFKIPIPPELGEAPAYQPTDKSHKKKHFNKRGHNNSRKRRQYHKKQ